MGEIIDMVTRKQITSTDDPFAYGSIAEHANTHIIDNLQLIGEVIERKAEITGVRRPNIEFTPGRTSEDDLVDGVVFRQQTGARRRVTVSVSENVASFFIRNGGEASVPAVERATLYASALGFAYTLLAFRFTQPRLPSMNGRLWKYIGEEAPLVVAPYRFAGGVLNSLGLGIDEDEMKVSQQKLTHHAASFFDPFDNRALRELASSYFRSY